MIAATRWALNDEMLLRYGDGYEWAWDEDGVSQSKPVEYPQAWLEQVSGWEPS